MCVSSAGSVLTAINSGVAATEGLNDVNYHVQVQVDSDSVSSSSEPFVSPPPSPLKSKPKPIVPNIDADTVIAHFPLQCRNFSSAIIHAAIWPTLPPPPPPPSPLPVCLPVQLARYATLAGTGDHNLSPLNFLEQFAADAGYTLSTIQSKVAEVKKPEQRALKNNRKNIRFHTIIIVSVREKEDEVLLCESTDYVFKFSCGSQKVVSWCFMNSKIETDTLHKLAFGTVIDRNAYPVCERLVNDLAMVSCVLKLYLDWSSVWVCVHVLDYCVYFTNVTDCCNQYCRFFCNSCCWYLASMTLYTKRTCWSQTRLNGVCFSFD